MPFKQLVQIIIAGSQVSPSVLSYKLDTLLQVVGKAFTQAVRQEIRLSQEAAKARGNSNQNKAQQAETARYEPFFFINTNNYLAYVFIHSNIIFRMGMTIDEAKQILNIEKIGQEEIEKAYSHLFECNDKAKGGSFYLQSKVVRAKERLDQEIVLESKKQGPDTG